MRLSSSGRIDSRDALEDRLGSFPAGHQHFLAAPRSRRQFMRSAAGVAGAAVGWQVLSPSLAFADEPNPRPIPGGIQPFGPGTEVFHLFLPGPGAEPSTITDFDGFTGLAAIGGTGTGTDPETGDKTSLFYDADVRFMKGTFIDREGDRHEGTFGVI